MNGITLLPKTVSFSHRVQRLCADRFGNKLVIAEGGADDQRSAALSSLGEYLFSLLSSWIVTADELSRFSTIINFRHGIADYPETGCHSFALWESARKYGAVCHCILPKIAAAEIIAETQFSVSHQESVESLKLKTMFIMLALFNEVRDYGLWGFIVI